MKVGVLHLLGLFALQGFYLQGWAVDETNGGNTWIDGSASPAASRTRGRVARFKGLKKVETLVTRSNDWQGYNGRGDTERERQKQQSPHKAGFVEVLGGYTGT
jgi:hypothetical protein